MMRIRPWLFALLLVPGLATAGLVELIAAAKASVLPVGTFAPTDSPRFGFRGTGFVVGDGSLVVTNAHVLPEVLPAADGVAMLAVRVPGADDDTAVRKATLLGVDRVHDLALLRIDGPRLPALKVAAAARVDEGLPIAVIGYPVGGVLGFAPVTHRGIVSSLTTLALPAPSSQGLNAQAVRRLRQGSFEVLQLDATVYPGNSGSPVFDIATGQVVAVVNMVLVKGARESALSHPSGISYAIPAHHVHDLLKNR